MKKIILRKKSIQGILSIPHFIYPDNIGMLRKFTLFALVAVLSITSCKKDDEAPANVVEAPTSIRFVNSTFLRSPFSPGNTPDMSPIDLYVDNVKITTSSIAFSNVSAYFPATSGSKKIEVKSGSTLIADTVLNIIDGRRYTLFIKDRSWQYPENTTTTPPTPITVVHLKRAIIPVIDNNTSAPAAGQAKVRFINMSSLPLNVFQSSITFLRVNAPGSPTPTTVLTQSLGNNILGSDFSALDAGSVTFRAHGANSSAILDATYMTELTTTLEAGKLYTVYVMSTENVVKTITKSPILLKIVENN